MDGKDKSHFFLQEEEHEELTEGEKHQEEVFADETTMTSGTCEIEIYYC
jgi:hypothetical protein